MVSNRTPCTVFLIHNARNKKEMSPRKKEVETAFWDDETMYQALQNMHDPLLHIIIHFIYIESLRVGEVMAVYIEDIDCTIFKVMC